MLEHLQPSEVFHFFEEICAIPHGSYNTDKISHYLYQFGKTRNLETYRDEHGNVILIKEATQGMEEKEPVILQGHMDMVAVKKTGCTKNMETEGLDLAVDGDFVYARDTSLGGDDGIAVAYALALLDSKDIPHPKLEVVITVDEEVGMDGAMGIDLSMLTGKQLLNIDSEKEGELTVACAGGACVQGIWKPAWNEAEGSRYQLTLAGLSGGHSGVEIHKGSANANQVMMQMLYLLSREADMTLLSFEGGTKDNVIPSSAVCEFVSRADETALTGLVAAMEESLKEEWKKTDPALTFSCVRMDEQEVKKAGEGKPVVLTGLDGNDFFDMLAFFMEAPGGVQKMDPELEGLVQTSLNMGVVRLTNSGNLKVTFSVRSSVEEEKEQLVQTLLEKIEKYGGKASAGGRYPAWEYRKESPLRDKMVSVYRRMFGKDMTVLSIHAGLECGVLAQKIEGLDAVSFGPDILDIHTTEERLCISSVERMWNYLLEVLRQ